jgi:hypothetical protein
MGYSRLQEHFLFFLQLVLTWSLHWCLFLFSLLVVQSCLFLKTLINNQYNSFLIALSVEAVGVVIVGLFYILSSVTSSKWSLKLSFTVCFLFSVFDFAKFYSYFAGTAFMDRVDAANESTGE